MTNDNTILVETFGNNPVIRIIDFFIDNPMFDYCKEDMIRELGMSKITFYKYFKMIEETGIVKVTRKVGKAKLYKLDEKNPVVIKLKELVWVLGVDAMQKVVDKERVPVRV
ncbi:MAG: winged helix-turn-helix transcriptional regulator [Candidatus Aenigmarchaeota archaeon]|nr:winged helix-turn-helix transcriptional regulator [Candidatus Aenigmarchaeota archaeon]